MLTELVRAQISQGYSPNVSEAQRAAATTDDSAVLVRTKVLRYRTQKYTLPTPCPLGTLVETVRGIVDDLRASMVSDWKFDLEWMGSELVFVPTLRHRFACVLTTPDDGTKEHVCLELDDLYTTSLFPLFDSMADGFDEVPEDVTEVTRGTCALSVYDLRLQRFLVSPLETAYAKWIIQNCV